MKSRIAMWVAWKLPKFVVYWCGMRIAAHASSGQWSSEGVPSISMTDAIERWGQSHKPLPLNYDHLIECEGVNTTKTVNNIFGHKYDGELSPEGYSICDLCGCRENTDRAASDCSGKDTEQSFTQFRSDMLTAFRHGRNFIPSGSSDDFDSEKVPDKNLPFSEWFSKYYIN